MGVELLIIGFTNLDVNEFPDGSRTTEIGGAGYFAASAAAAARGTCRLVTRIGADLIFDSLAGRFEGPGIVVMRDVPTARSLQIYHDLSDLTRRTVRLEQGVAQYLCPDDIPAGWCDEATHIHIGTMPPAQQARFLDALDRKIGARGARRQLVSIDSDHYLMGDPANLSLIRANFGRCDIAFLNRVERELLADAIAEIPMVVLKKDREGAELLRFGRVAAGAAAASVEVRDVTGAGDVLAGIFLSGLARGATAQAALDAAVKAATFSVTQRGIDHLFDHPAMVAVG